MLRVLEFLRRAIVMLLFANLLLTAGYRRLLAEQEL
jgi:hypothetical protein